jgi:hypothetical protein
MIDEDPVIKRGVLGSRTSLQTKRFFKDWTNFDLSILTYLNTLSLHLHWLLPERGFEPQK